MLSNGSTSNPSKKQIKDYIFQSNENVCQIGAEI